MDKNEIKEANKRAQIADNYANQKWWQGFYTGWTCSCVFVGVGAFIILS